MGAQPDHPLFAIKGIPLSKARFTTQMKAALQATGVIPTYYHGHSLRLDGATLAKEASLTADEIQILGRWTSAVYANYIMYSPTQRLQSAQRLTGTAQRNTAIQLSAEDCRTWAAQMSTTHRLMASSLQGKNSH